ncbi:MAG: hypothetical protein IT292_02360 [Deltaproteobacteria bacterium]|nr:hypothetical protein [Deltaproteobacteria bacterium]
MAKVRFSQNKIKNGLSLIELLHGGFLEETLANVYLVENKLMKECHPREAVGSIGQVNLLELSEIKLLTEIDRLIILNKNWINYLGASIIAERSMPFAYDYQQLITNRGGYFWTQAVSSVMCYMELLSDAERICELLFCYKLRLGVEELKLLNSNPKFYIATLSILAQLNDELNSVVLSGDSNLFHYDDLRKIINRIAKHSDYSKSDIENVVTLGLFAYFEFGLMKALLPMVEREYLIGRAAELILELTEQHA